jgi:serine/threonine protein kinase
VTGRVPDPARDLYREAVRLPPDARLDFLRQACQGDDALFARVAARLSDLGTTLAAPEGVGSGRDLFSPEDFRGTERFVIRRQMGQGSFGVVYEVLDTTTGTHLALKTLQNVTSESLYRFKREFRSLADVSHRNLAQLYELASHGDHWFFTMELIHGRPFLDYVWDGPTPPGEPSREHLDRLTRGLRQLVQGLHALHASGHLHRDVKPANVLVDLTDRVVLLDFGLIVDARNDASQQTLLIAGTPVYMSPEQAAGLPLTPASDLYSVGVMLYEALTGTTPFAGTYLEILTAKQHAEPQPVSSSVAGVPPALDRLCQSLLHRDAARRPTVQVVLDLLGGQPDEALRITHGHAPGDAPPPFIGRAAHLPIWIGRSNACWAVR